MSLFLDLLFPKKCFFCHQSSHYICPNCAQTLVPNSTKILPHHPEIDFSLSLFRYTGPLKDILHDLKYNFVYDLVPTLSDLISSTLKKNYPHILNYWQSHHATIIPVPLHNFRYNWRGFNQSELIASKLAQNLNLNFEPNLIIRHRFTASQANLPQHYLRSQNVADAFSLSAQNTSQSNDYIIFDDVSTTSSTLLSVAKILNPIKPNSISFLTLAGS